MSCGAVQTGDHFAGAMLAQIDCQAQAIGTFGYGALAAPGSPVAGLLLALLILFIASLGLRLMFGDAPGGRDLLADVLRIGIVITLATSWPAWRPIAYETVMRGPAELSGRIALAAGLPGGGGDLNARLENADRALVSLTAFGTGRLTGGIVGSSDLGDSTRGIAMADQTGFAWGRVIFLAGTIGPLALVRLSAGFLLAIAPLMAGLLLFTGTSGVFAGWLRGLGTCLLGAAVLSICQGAELAVLESWLGDALSQRQANVLTPAVPTELLVIVLLFSIAAAGSLALVVRVMFFASLPSLRLAMPESLGQPLVARGADPLVAAVPAGVPGEHPRAQAVAFAVADRLRREERDSDRSRLAGIDALTHGSQADRAANGAAGFDRSHDALGNSFRQPHRRRSAAVTKRDSGK